MNFSKQPDFSTAVMQSPKKVFPTVKIGAIILTLLVVVYFGVNSQKTESVAPVINQEQVLADKQRAIDIRIKKAELDKQIETKRSEANQAELEALKLEQEKTQLEPTPIETPKKDNAVAVIEPVILTPQSVPAEFPNLADFYSQYKQYYTADNTCHPYLIAAIHYRETNFGSSNAWNGQGAFQNLSNKYQPNSQVDDWEVQVKQACLHLKGKVKVQTLLDLSDEKTIGTALARYNGCRGQVYTACSYVVNKSEYMATGTKCAVDGCAYTTTDNRFGALTLVRLAKNLKL